MPYCVATTTGVNDQVDGRSLVDTSGMSPLHTVSQLRQGTLDSELGALLWLMCEGGVPLVVASASHAVDRSGLATALLATDPDREWVVLDADAEPLTPARLTALLRGGVGLGITVTAVDLEGVLERLEAQGLPEDGVRRLGVVVVAQETSVGIRLMAVHYLRPTERDGQGHIQRRPPAVLAAWDPDQDAFEHYAWAITPELADRVDRSQADFEDRLHDRAVFLAAASGDDADAAEQAARIRRYLEAEPSREPAPAHAPATPSPFEGGLTDPDTHVH